MSRTFGTLNRVPKGWYIVAEPQVMIRLKRVFAKVDEDARGGALISDSAENALDLVWFTQRYPLITGEGAYLKARAVEQMSLEARVKSMLGPGYVPREYRLALPLRTYQRIAADLASKTRRLLLADEVGLGKAQPLDAQVLTPGGWRRMGDLRVGDLVVDPDTGVAVEVTGVYPQGEREVFRVVTADGASAECCDEHLWTVRTSNDRARGTSRTLPLSEIRIRVRDRKGPNEVARYFLPLAEPVDFGGASLRVNPWLLGALLGDGGLTGGNVRITIADPDTQARAQASCPPGIALRREPDSITYRFSKERWMGRQNVLLDQLRSLGMMGCGAASKRIPRAAMTMPVADRVELLRGLMDTDGTIGKDGCPITFTTISPGLADDVAELVGGLGGFTSRSSRVTSYTHNGERRAGQRAFTLNVRVPFCPFHMPKKVARWRPPLLARAIRSVEPVGIKPVQCIRVESKRNLYITDGFIVTHNTASSIGMLCEAGARPALVVTLTHLPRQWQLEVKRFMPGASTHVLRGTRPYHFGNPDVVICNYHKLDAWHQALAGCFRTVIFDEAQELRRNDSNKYRAAKHIVEKARIRVGLTATPIYNFGGELHSVMDVIAPGSLGTWDEFKREWCEGASDLRGPSKVAIKDPRALGSYMLEAGLMLRRTRRDVGRELAALTNVPHAIGADLKAIDDIASDAAELARIILAQGGRARGEQLHAAEEFSNRLRQATGIAKAKAVAAFVKMLVESGESVLLFGWHRVVYKLWAEELKDLNPVFFTGTETPLQKQTAKDEFLAGRSKVLVMSLRAGAGIDGLQKVCRTVVYGELDWSPGVHHQATGRIHRDGQADPVVAYYLIAEEGSDPVVSDTLGMKRAQSDAMLDPKAPLVSMGQADPDRIKKLAAAFLEQRRVGGRRAA